MGLFDRFRRKVKETPPDEGLLAEELEHDSRAVFFQEVTVDGLRHSDCE